MDHNSKVNLQVDQGDLKKIIILNMDQKLYNTHGQSLKKPCAILKLHFKNTMGIPFLPFSNSDQNAPIFFRLVLI